MTMITWQNIATPSLKEGLTAQVAAGEQIAGMLDPLKSMVKDAQTQEKTNFDAQAKLNTQKLIAAAQSSNDANALTNDFTMQKMMDTQGGAAMADFGAVMNAAKDRKGTVADDNTQRLYADVRDFTDINQLNSAFDPAVLQEKYGLGGYNQDMVDNQVKDRVGVLRQEATDEVVANSPTFNTHAEISAYLNDGKFSNKNLDRKEVETALVNKLNGVQADKQAKWGEEDHARKKVVQGQQDAEFARTLKLQREEDATKLATSAYISVIQAGGSDADATKAAYSIPGSNQAKVLSATTQAGVDMSNVNPREQQSIQSFIDQGAYTATKAKLDLNTEHAGLQSEFAKVSVIGADDIKAVTTMVDKDGTPTNPVSALKRAFGGTMMLGDPDTDVDNAYTNLSKTIKDPAVVSAILWKAAGASPQEDKWFGNKDLDGKAFIAETKRLEGLYTKQLTMKEQMLKLENTIANVSATVDLDVKVQANALKSQYLSPNSNTPVDHKYDESATESIVTGAKNELKALRLKLEKLQEESNSKSPEDVKGDKPKSKDETTIMTDELKSNLTRDEQVKEIMDAPGPVGLLFNKAVEANRRQRAALGLDVTNP